MSANTAAKLTPREARLMVGKDVTIWARRSNTSTYKSKPERFTGRVIALGQVLGAYQSQPLALVLVDNKGGVQIISLTRVAMYAHGLGGEVTTAEVQP